jgi:hypothetical protein
MEYRSSAGMLLDAFRTPKMPQSESAIESKIRNADDADCSFVQEHPWSPIRFTVHHEPGERVSDSDYDCRDQFLHPVDYHHDGKRGVLSCAIRPLSTSDSSSTERKRES